MARRFVRRFRRLSRVMFYACQVRTGSACSDSLSQWSDEYVALDTYRAPVVRLDPVRQLTATRRERHGKPVGTLANGPSFGVLPEVLLEPRSDGVLGVDGRQRSDGSLARLWLRHVWSVCVTGDAQSQHPNAEQRHQNPHAWIIPHGERRVAADEGHRGRPIMMPAPRAGSEATAGFVTPAALAPTFEQIGISFPQ